MSEASQIRAARALLGASQEELAKVVGTSTKTIRRAEAGEGKVAKETLAAIRAALEAAGVEFIAENGGGPGVRLMR